MLVHLSVSCAGLRRFDSDCCHFLFSRFYITKRSKTERTKDRIMSKTKKEPTAYIIKLSFMSEQPYYIRDNGDGTWDELYSPHKATTFTLKKDAKSWAKKNTTFQEYVSIGKVKEEIAKFDKWAKKGFVRRTFKTVDNKLSRPYNDELPDEVLTWHIAAKKAPDSDVRYEDYKTWPELYGVFKCIFNIEMYIDHDDIKLMTFSMAVCKDTEFSIFCKELEKIIDHVTYMDGEDKIIDIFDRFLHEHGNSAKFIVHNDGTYSVLERYDEGEHNVSLKKAFDYWKRERYYD